MKYISKAIIFTGILVASALAVPVQRFPGWPKLIDESPNIVVVRCASAPSPSDSGTNDLVMDFKDGVAYSNVRIECELKGNVTESASRLMSQYKPVPGEVYLIFSQYHDKVLQAIEPYRVTDIGSEFSTNLLAKKALNEQIRILFEQAISKIDSETAKNREEKSRLQEGVKLLK